MSLTDDQRVRWARGLLWLALLTPIAYSEPRLANDIRAGGLTALDAVRGGGALVFYILARQFARPLRRGHGVPELAIIGFCVVVVGTSLLPDNPAPRATLLKAIPLVGSYLALFRLVRMYETTEQALAALAGACHVVMLSALFQWALFPELVYARVPGDSFPRLGSILPQVSPNPLAYVTVSGILAIALRVHPEWLRKLPFFMPSILLGAHLAVLVGTRTRSGMVLGMAIIAVLAVAAFRSRPFLVTYSLLSALAGALWLFPGRFDSLVLFFQRGQSAEAISSLTGRTHLWDLALSKWSESKLLGFGYFSGHRLGLVGIPAEQSNLDSTWLESLLDVGILGTAALAVFVLAGGHRLISAGADSKGHKAWAVGVFTYGVLVSFINPTIQGTGAAGILLAFSIAAWVPKQSLRRTRLGTGTGRREGENGDAAEGRHAVGG